MSTAIRRALYGKLVGDSTLTAMLGAPAPGFSQAVYYQQPPEGATYPSVIFSKNSGMPTEAFGDPSALETDVWLVKAVDRSDTADVAEAAAERIAALLNDASLSIAGGTTLLYLRRQSDVDYPETVDGVLYRHAGSLYRIVTD